jgi:hypothetical protein
MNWGESANPKTEKPGKRSKMEQFQTVALEWFDGVDRAIEELLAIRRNCQGGLSHKTVRFHADWARMAKTGLFSGKNTEIQC